MPYLTLFPAPPGGGGYNPSLLAFKIAPNEQYAGDWGEIRADQITIEIELRLNLAPIWFVDGQYSLGSERYAGLYYLDFGEYPQTQETDTNVISAMGTVADSNGYYTSTANNKKYARKGAGTESDPYVYYLVEPIRWLIIGSGANLAQLGFPNKNFDSLSNNQFLLLSEKVIESYHYNSGGNYQAGWGYTKLYTYLTTFNNKVFSTDEKNMLANMITIFSKNDSSYKPNNYNYSNILLSSVTDYCGSFTTSNPGYWVRENVMMSSICYYINLDSGSMHSTAKESYCGVRPIVVLNFQLG